MALKKSDLYSSLWAGADQLRGGMDASQYKDYVLTLLFVKYVSDKAKADKYSLIDVPKGGSFEDLVKLRGKANIGEEINVAIRKLAEANDLQGVLTNADFDDPTKLGEGKAMVDRLSKLIGIFQDLDFSVSRAEGDDLLGDAYEYLMRHFATQSGKSKGQFYTPAEVSRVMAQVIGIKATTPKSAAVYDPTCGSGSLLIKVAATAPKGLTVYGQEKDNATWALAKMNMILHGNTTADIRLGDTIVDPKFRSGDKLETFDFLVANPPFSVKSWTNGLENEYGRFDGYARPPEKNGDYAFLLHMVKSLKSTGKGAVILPHGVLFRGNVEATIRTELIKRRYVKGIVGLPPNLFYGTGIPACIIVLDKENASDRTGIFMIDASKGFLKDGNKNRLRSRDMHKIIDTFNKQIEIERYSRMVPLEEIADTKNDYNLNIPRYIDSSEPEDIQDLHAHLHGGIPEPDIDALQPYWDAFPSLRSTLFKPNRPGYVDLGVDIADVQQLVLDSDEFKKFASDVRSKVNDWFATHRQELVAIDANTQPNDLIGVLGDDLLTRFKPVALVDEYDIYEQLMTYWHGTMHDDVFMIMNEGWRDAAQPRAARIVGNDANGKPKYEDAHIVTGSRATTKRYVMDLVPPALVIKRYLADDQAKVDGLTTEEEQASQVLQEYVEEQGVEEGLIWDAIDDAGKVTQKSLNVALREAKATSDDETVKALVHVLQLIKTEAAAKKSAKEAHVALDIATVKKYKDLSEGDVKSLVLEDKWHNTVTNRIESVVVSLTRSLVFRIQQLGDRYAETVGELDASIADLESKVARHLDAMGISS